MTWKAAQRSSTSRPGPSVGRYSGAIGIDPSAQSAQTTLHVVSYFVDPEANDVVSKLDQSLVLDLIPPAQFTGPISVISFSVDLDDKLSIAVGKEKIDHVLFDGILGDK
jgi:hypothetical protein